MNILIYILIALFIALFVFMSYVTKTSRAKARVELIKESLNDFKRIKVAIAGSPDGCHRATKFVEVSGINLTIYRDYYGNVLNPDNYNLFVVDGDSMKYCGIRDKNLIFVTKGFVIEDGSLPTVLVIKREDVEENSPEYKIRRVWLKTRYVNDEDLVVEIRELLQSNDFQKLRRLNDYPGDEEILTDFKDNRLKQYRNKYLGQEANDKDKEIIISSTLDTIYDKIHLSIHPVNLVSGKVMGSFNVDKNRLEK